LIIVIFIYLYNYIDAILTEHYNPNESEDKIISMSAFNDDFCDCLSLGHDEPGTAACP
jgi:hypothetical protein